ncbi:CDP-diacylglycerol--glycerol-3-phosphate 3-phosphatidyltransferase [Acidipila sp. EB88]|uniref:CDP-diacylglycerol--glycerol-3-phosphate 3-phosphatidyltransferase n=1 Tax=Acidipila sp. EB88 TaxID=2305226 RepID=UPI000F5E9EDC|nr:CDP-diacylglycerol--glycerol-3-phosphate 3-phosphatidyltransferase [Acidipila sp. EB88]RRA47718.1 CDP-diacylglycerol--glycerol-3-phosphate 3-phosphatidyltransferase [Acidipila sp. EB88]
MNLPNSITTSRILCVPLLIWMLSPHFPLRGVPGGQELFVAIFFLLAFVTDGVDGYLARKNGQVTTLGTLLDPLADKLMVTAAFIALVQYNPHIVKPWIATVVIGREFLVSGLRSIASSEGFTISASDLGKLKTVIQIVSVIAAVLDHRWQNWYIGWFVFPVDAISVASIYFMAAISVLSAVDYFWAFWSKINHAGESRRKSENALLLAGKQPHP